jgi:hypothetical protein
VVFVDAMRSRSGRQHSGGPVAVNVDAAGNAFARLRIWEHPDAVDRYGVDVRRAATRVELVAGNVDSCRRCRADLTTDQSLQLESLLSVLNDQLSEDSS